MSALSSNQTDFKSIQVNSGYAIVGQILSRTLQIVYCAILVRHYGAVNYGIFQSAIHWYVALVPITLLGFGPTLALHIGSNQPGARALIHKTLIIRLLFASILCAIVVVFAWVLPTHGTRRVFLLIFAPLLILRALLNWTREIYTAHESTQFHFRQIGVSNFLQLAVGVCIIHFSGSLVHIGISMIVITSLELGSSIYFIYWKYIFAVAKSEAVDLLAYVRQSLPIGLSQIAIRWMLLGPIAVGQWFIKPSEGFGAASFVVLNLFFVCLLFDSVSRSWLTVAGRQIDHQSFVLLQSKILKQLLLISVGIAFVGYFAGPWMMYVVFGTTERKILTMFGLGLGAVIPYMIGATLTQYLVVRSAWKQLIKTTSGGLFVAILSVFIVARYSDERLIVMCSLLGLSTFAGMAVLYCKKTIPLPVALMMSLAFLIFVGFTVLQGGLNV